MLVCYVLMRHLPLTMNTGKALAQVHHAGVQMMVQWQNKEFKKIFDEYNRGNGWGTTDAFGTTIVLEAINKVDTVSQIEAIVDYAAGCGYIAGSVTDPTYPVDHEVTMPLLTVGYILGDKDKIEKDIPELKSQWKLHI